MGTLWPSSGGGGELMFIYTVVTFGSLPSNALAHAHDGAGLGV